MAAKTQTAKRQTRKAAEPKKRSGTGTAGERNLLMRDRLGPAVPHLRGCPKVRYDEVTGDELDLYESYSQDGIDPRDRRLPPEQQRKVKLRVTRCLKCAGHLVTDLNGKPFSTTEEEADDGAEEPEEELEEGDGKPLELAGDRDEGAGEGQGA